MGRVRARARAESKIWARNAREIYSQITGQFAGSSSSPIG